MNSWKIDSVFCLKNMMIKQMNDNKKKKKIEFIIIKIILDLTLSLRRFMRKSYWWLQKKIFNDYKNLFLYARSRFDCALIKSLREIIAWRSCHHHHLSLCLLNIWSRIARQVIRSALSSTKTVLINSFSWISWSSFWFFWRWS
jgi:hypothetical protein